MLPAIVLVSPVLATVGVASVIVASLIFKFYSRLPQIFLRLLGACLLGYAFFGKGFAYLGVPPLFVGEAILGFGILTLSLTGGLTRLFRSPLSWLIAIYMALGATATLPYAERYGLDAFRDAVVWGYGTFALVVATFLIKSKWVYGAIEAYGRALSWFLFWIPMAIVVQRTAFQLVPKWPTSGVGILYLKSGDIGVHLAGIFAFLMIGLNGLGGSKPRRAVREWLVWGLWFITYAAIFNNRGGILTVLVVVVLLLLLRPMGRWGKQFLMASVLLTLFIGFDIEIPITPKRSISAETIVVTVQSLVGDTGQQAFDGSRQWRLRWWGDIAKYTVFGDYFWTGKGYGINLADADGYQVTAEGTLRSPHNGHLTILARGGVPSALSWLLLQGTFAFLMFRAYLRARRLGHEAWSKINLWVLCYWLAFMVNGAFDVFLEGPQGGIWFWSVVGLGIATLEIQRTDLSQRNRVSYE